MNHLTECAQVPTSVDGGGTFLLAGPGGKGEKPAGIDKVLQADTELVLAVYRTQLFGPDNLDNVKEIQAGYGVQPLSAFLKQPAPSAAAPIDFPTPLSTEGQRTSLDFFACHPGNYYAPSRVLRSTAAGLRSHSERRCLRGCDGPLVQRLRIRLPRAGRVDRTSPFYRAPTMSVVVTSTFRGAHA